MELDELKSTWTQLETKMKEHQLFNEKIVKEIHKNRYNKSLSQLINYNFIACIIALIAITILIYRMSTIYFGPFKMTIFVLGIVIGLCAFIIGVINLKLLYKIDYSRSVSHNIELTRRYKIRIKKQNWIAYISITIYVILVIIAALLSPNMELWRWMTIGGTLAVAGLAAIWEYKRIHKVINSILESLNEIKELEEE